MIDSQNLTMTEKDFERLMAILKVANSEAAAALEEELGRASIVPSEEIPRDVVTMNSRVKFQDENTGKVSEVTLVYPKDADVSRGKVSVLAPVGTALIGLRVGQSISWPMPDGRTRDLKIVEIDYQPEAAGDWDL